MASEAWSSRMVPRVCVLLPHFKTDKEGKVLPGGVVFGGLVTPFETDGVEEVQDYYQYCTAIPTGWALAQSWNRELAGVCREG